MDKNKTGYYDIMLTESKTSDQTNITTGKFLNGFRSKQKLPENIDGCSIKFNSLSIDDHTQEEPFCNILHHHYQNMVLL